MPNKKKLWYVISNGKIYRQNSSRIGSTFDRFVISFFTLLLSQSNQSDSNFHWYIRAYLIGLLIFISNETKRSEMIGIPFIFIETKRISIRYIISQKILLFFFIVGLPFVSIGGNAENCCLHRGTEESLDFFSVWDLMRWWPNKIHVGKNKIIRQSNAHRTLSHSLSRSLALPPYLSFFPFFLFISMVGV